MLDAMKTSGKDLSAKSPAKVKGGGTGRLAANDNITLIRSGN